MKIRDRIWFPVLVTLVSLLFATRCSNQPPGTPEARPGEQSGAAVSKESSAEKGAAEKMGDATESPAVKHDAPVAEMLTLPAGTAIEIRLSHSLDTETAADGDQFEGTLDANLTVAGKTAAPAGSLVKGTVYHAKQSGKVKGRAELGLELTDLVVGEPTYKIATSRWFRQAESTKKHDAAWVGGGAAAGAIIGAIAGGKKGAAIGAAAGGGAGTAKVIATRGKEVELAAESKLTFRLKEPVAVYFTQPR